MRGIGPGRVAAAAGDLRRSPLGRSAFAGDGAGCPSPRLEPPCRGWFGLFKGRVSGLFGTIRLFADSDPALKAIEYRVLHFVPKPVPGTRLDPAIAPALAKAGGGQ